MSRMGLTAPRAVDRWAHYCRFSIYERVTTTTGRYFSRFSRECTRARSLYGNQISAVGASALAEALKFNATLTHLT